MLNEIVNKEPNFKQGDYVKNTYHNWKNIHGKVVYSYIHDYQQVRYYVLENIDEHQREQMLETFDI